MRLIDADHLLERLSLAFELVGIENFLVSAPETPEFQVNVKAMIKGERTFGD